MTVEPIPALLFCGLLILAWTYIAFGKEDE
jgi:hypothetical protein